MREDAAVLVGLKAPDPPLSDGVVTLSIPDRPRSVPPDAEVVRWILGAVPREPLDAAKTFARQREWWQAGTNAVFWIEALGHDEPLGVARVMFGLVDPFGFAEIGYILEPRGRGQGYATRAVLLLARWTFDDLNIGRLQARTHPDNAGSQRVLERVGFQREGIARAGHVLPMSGERIDPIMWSLLPSDLR